MCYVPLFANGRHVSCQKCPECLARLRGDWIYRSEQEQRLHKHNYFITLTFNPQSLPDSEDGVWDLFFKFRKAVNRRYGTFPYLCTLEEGDLHGRYHLHLLSYMDVPLPKSVIRQLWPHGFITRKAQAPKTIRYTCSYMFKQDLYNKVKRYRSSNNYGGVPVLPYRIRVVSGRPVAVPLPRYYRRKFEHCKEFAIQYFSRQYSSHEDFESVYSKCWQRYSQFSYGYGKPKNRVLYVDFLLNFIKSRARVYESYCDPGRTTGYLRYAKPYIGLSKAYCELLRRVDGILARNGDRRSGNLSRYLMIDCPMSPLEAEIRVSDKLSSIKSYDVRKKSLTYFSKYRINSFGDVLTTLFIAKSGKKPDAQVPPTRGFDSIVNWRSRWIKELGGLCLQR